MQIVTLLPAALVAGLVTFSVAPPPPQDPAPAKSTDFVIEAGKHNVRELIDRAARYLGRNYIYSEMDVANVPDQEIHLQKALALDAVGCEEVVSQLAFSKGVVMLPVDEKRGIHEWVFMHGPKRQMILSQAKEMTPEEVLRRRNMRIPVRTTYPLEQLDGNQMVNQLRPFLLAQNQQFLVIGATPHAILLQGFSHEVAATLEMLEKLEGPPPELEPGLSTWKAKVDQRLDAIEKALRR